MKLKYKSAEKEYNESFHVRRENKPYLEGNWHYHEEIELIYILEGEGFRIVGDSLSNFHSSQLALIGSWVPHLWKNVESKNSDGWVDIIVVKFNSKIGGQELFNIPEFEKVRDLLELSKRGLIFGNKTINAVNDLLIKMTTCSSPEKIIILQMVLNLLSESEDYKLLSSPGFTLSTTVSGENRLSRVFNFISENFTRQISLEELAQEAAMTPSSFCRFFKIRTNNTVFNVINEFRVGKACQMLISGNMTVTEVCFNSGFNSLTTFNRIFKEYKKITPRDYKKKYQLLNK